MPSTSNPKQQLQNGLQFNMGGFQCVCFVCCFVYVTKAAYFIDFSASADSCLRNATCWTKYMQIIMYLYILYVYYFQQRNQQVTWTSETERTTWFFFIKAPCFHHSPLPLRRIFHLNYLITMQLMQQTCGGKSTTFCVHLYWHILTQTCMHTHSKSQTDVHRKEYTKGWCYTNVLQSQFSHNLL